MVGRTTVRRGQDTELADTEIDLLAISRQSDQYMVGECKFKGKPFRYSEYLDATAKLSNYKVRLNFIIICSRSQVSMKKSLKNPGEVTAA